VRDVEVRPGGIDLGQLLKFSGLVDTGGDAKALLGEGVVLVNDEVDTRRGRTLVNGDVVAIPGEDPVRVIEAS
jgi:ribosome-associated protein